MATKNRVTINLDDYEYRALQAIADEIERSLSWTGRKAVREYLEKNRGLLNKEIVEDEKQTASRLKRSSQ